MLLSALKRRICRNNLISAYTVILVIQNFNFLKNFELIKSWNIYFRAFFMFLFFISGVAQSQNTIKKELKAGNIKSVVIDGNQIFNISVVTKEKNNIAITSTLDGEYQNKYQIATKVEDNTLALSLEFMSFEDIPDDKRNAHKIIAATLHLEIPKKLSLNVFSDVGSVDVEGSFSTLYIELLQGTCIIIGESEYAKINTIDGNIRVVTKHVKAIATSNNGRVDVDNFDRYDSLWELNSINGNITVVKQE